MNLKVTEKSTGNFQIGAGYSNYEKLTFMGAVTQSNLFGTGNYLSTQINTSKINQVYSVSYTNPYYTDEGISRGFDVYKRRTNATTIAVSQYTSETYGAGVRYGVPISDEETFHYGLSFEQTTIGLTTLSPQRYIDYVNTFGSTNRNWLGNIGWSRDTRDSAIFTTDGTVQRSFIEVSIPSSDQRFYKWTYQHQWYYPVSHEFYLDDERGCRRGRRIRRQVAAVLQELLRGRCRLGARLRPQFFGTKRLQQLLDGRRQARSGKCRVVVPDARAWTKEKSVRLSAFLDGGAVYGPAGQVPGSTGMRYSTGLGLTWFSPAGPIKLSWAKPLNQQPQDKIQHIQFTLGSMF